MEIGVLIRSGTKPYAANPPPQYSRCNSITTGQLVSEIFMFESVDTQTDGCTDGRRLESQTISSPWAFGSGELKIHVQIRRFTCCLNMGLNLKILKMSPKLFTWRYKQKALQTRLIFSPKLLSTKSCVRLWRSKVYSWRPDAISTICTILCSK